MAFEGEVVLFAFVLVALCIALWMDPRKPDHENDSPGVLRAVSFKTMKSSASVFAVMAALFRSVHLLAVCAMGSDTTPNSLLAFSCFILLLLIDVAGTSAWGACTAIEFGWNKTSVRQCAYSCLCVVPGGIAFLFFLITGTMLNEGFTMAELTSSAGDYRFITPWYKIGMFFVTIYVLVSWTAPVIFAADLFEKSVVRRFRDYIEPNQRISESTSPATADST